MRASANLIAAGLFAVALALLARPALAVEDSAVCGLETARQEQLQSIPSRLLHAISLVESGRWDSDHKEVLAWPWTIMAEGEGRFLPSKAAAISEVRKLQARGVKNIDVGCMQVNLLAHPNAFANLDAAFEPSTNVAYAAQFLNNLYDSVGDWQTAGAFYHSQTPELAAGYKTKLVATWDKLRQHGDDRMQLASHVIENRPPLGVPTFAVPTRPDLLPLVSPDIEARRDSGMVKATAERVAAQRAADAYRQAKLEEYRQRKAQAQAQAADRTAARPNPRAML